MEYVSNYRLYATRKYGDVNNLQEEEIELGQFRQGNPTSVQFPDDYFQLYDENIPATYFTRFLTSYGGNTLPNGYTNYRPGIIYLPEKSFTIYDFFDDDQIKYFPENVESLINGYAQGGYHGYMISKKIFWQNPFGYNIIPVLKIEVGKTNNELLNWRDKFTMALDMFMTKYQPSAIKWDGSNYYIDNDLQRENLVINKTYFCCQGAAVTWGYTHGGIVSNRAGSGYFYQSEMKVGFERFWAMLKTARFYPIWGLGPTNSTAVDGIRYAYYTGQSNNPQVVGNKNQYDGMSFLVDISNCPNYPTSGFGYIQNHPQFNSQSGFDTGIVTRIDYSQEPPKPNSPDDKDDPYDDYPGGGPGQDPDDKGGDGDYDNTSDPNPPPSLPTLSAVGSGILTVFNPDSSQLAELSNKLWDPVVWEAIKHFFTNPMDTIVGFSMIPVKPKTASSREIHLGFYKTGVNAPLVDSDYVIVNCGTIPITRYYGSYLDYDPYTRISCYLPYIGEVDIDPDIVMQTNLNIQYYVNVITGDIVAMLLANGNLFYTAAGNCIRQLPLSQTDYSSIIQAAIDAVGAIVTAAAGAAVGEASIAASKQAGKEVATARSEANQIGNAGSIVDSVMSGKFRYQHAGQIGTGSGQLTKQVPYLLIERPRLDLASNYKSFVGYPCNETLLLGSCKGFTQIEAGNIYIPNATDEELAEIKELLTEGVLF